MQNVAVINDIGDVTNLLKGLVENPSDDLDFQIHVQNLPSLEIYLVGDKFNNSITPSIMQGIIELQKSIYRAYMLAKYGNYNLQTLNQHERRVLELKVIVNPGSSDVIIKLFETFDNLFGLINGMENKQKYIIILTILAMIASGVGWLYFDSYLEHKAEQTNAAKEIVIERERTRQLLESQQKLIDAVQLSFAAQHANTNQNQTNDKSKSIDQDGVEKHEVKQDSIDSDDAASKIESDVKSPESSNKKTHFKLLNTPDKELLSAVDRAKKVDSNVRLAAEDTEVSMRKLMASTSTADLVRFNNQFEASGYTIQQIVSVERKTSEDMTVKSEFRVLTIDSHKTEFMQARLRPTDGSFPDFNARFSDSSIGKNKLEKLKTALTGYHPIALAITAKKLHNKLNDAMIAQVGSVDMSKSFRDDGNNENSTDT